MNDLDRIHDPVLLDEPIESLPRFIVAGHGDMGTRLLVLLGEFDGPQGTARGIFSQGEDDSAVGVPDVPFGALEVVGSRCLLELVLAADGTVLGFASPGAPALMWEAVANGDVKGGTIGADLAADDEICYAIHYLKSLALDKWQRKRP